jgi:hypothetical protein
MLASRLALTCCASALVLAAACQPVAPDGDELGPAAASGEGDQTPVGAPASGVPDTLAALLESVGSSAAEWQVAARPVEVFAGLAGGAVQRAQVTYLAPDADRFMVVTVSPDGTSQERPTLETLGLAPVDAPGMEQVPAPPEGTLDPFPLAAAAADALAACGLGGDPGAVLYATGAPAAWDGQTWTQQPAWTATIRVADEGAVQVDPTSGEALPGSCSSAT